MKKIVVNENCIGCGACIAVDSEHFDFDENGLSSVISNDNIESDDLKNAISTCPVNAIKIEENKDCHCEECSCGDKCECDENDCHCEGCHE